MQDSILRSAWLTYSRVLKRVNDRLSTVHGIDFEQYVILSLLHAAKGGLNAKGLAGKVFKSASSTMRLLICMEKTGVVSRRNTSGGSLNSVFEISPSGVDMYLNAFCTISVCNEAIFSNLDENSKSNLYLALDAIGRD